jgi:hypothetical protein
MKFGVLALDYDGTIAHRKAGFLHQVCDSDAGKACFAESLGGDFHNALVSFLLSQSWNRPPITHEALLHRCAANPQYGSATPGQTKQENQYASNESGNIWWS